MASSNERYMNHFNNPTSGIEISIKIDNASNEKDIDYFCFVEGSTDKYFYNSISHDFFSMNKIHYIFMGYKKFNEYEKGKKAVILATKVVSKRHRKLLRRFVFIADHDYFGIDEYKKVIEEKYLNMLTILPVYSYENYYFYKNNLNNGLGSYLNDRQLSDLNNELSTFCKETIDYFALKATKTAAHAQSKYNNCKELIEYQHSSKDKNIFIFDFSSKEYFKKDLLDYEVNQLRRIVYKEPKTKKLYEKLKTTISQGKDFYKGKILFQYMTDYLKYHYNLNAKHGKLNNEINRLLEVDLDIRLPE